MYSIPQGHSAPGPFRLSKGGRSHKIPQSPSEANASVGKKVLLEGIYYGDSAGARRGPKALYAQAHEEGHTHITRKDCEEYLATQTTYTLYKPARRNYPRNSIVANFCGQIYQVTTIQFHS